MIGRPMLRYEEKIDNVEIKVKSYFCIDLQSIMIGNDAAPLRHMLELSHPVEQGIVKNWDDLELIWKYGFDNVQVYVVAQLKDGFEL